MNETRVQEWLASLCSTQKSAVEGIVVHASSAGTVAVAQWSRDTYSAMETLQRTAESAMRVHQAIVETVQRAPEPQSDTGRVVAVPLMRDNKAIGGLALCFDELGPDAAGDVMDALSASGALMMSEAGAFRPVQSVAQSDLVLQLQAAILSQPHADEAAATFATRLAQLFECARVSVGFVENGYARVSAFSHGTVPDARQALGRTIAAAMDEAIAQAATLSLPPASETPRITLAHADLHRISGGPVCSIPVVNFGVITGAVTLEWPSGRVPNGGELARCEHIISLVGPVLALKVETDIGGVARVRRWCAQQWDRLTTPGELPFRFAVIGGALLLGFFLWVPMPYSISAPTRLEGSVQRALVAASDGFIQQTSVRPGDRVKEGQVLAELAQHDLQLERSKRDSELAQYANAYGAAFARADRS
ncbi:MAG TPA: hypothetical protein VK663_06405, partial [Burkholderiales bacterium]|nr:hypothetical protein [Burkholderiales bacterium]